MPYPPNENCTVLLDNMNNQKCDMYSRLKLAYSAGFEAVILFNDSRPTISLSSWESNSILPYIFASSVLNEDAIRLMNYAYPKTVRFFVVMTNANTFQPIYPNYILPLFVFRTGSWLLFLQVFLIGVILLGIVEHNFMTEDSRLISSLATKIYTWMYPPSIYDVLKVPSKTPGLLAFIKQIVKKHWKHNQIKKSFVVDISKIVHDPWTVPITKNDFNDGCALGFGSFGTVLKVSFNRTNPMKEYAMKNMLKNDSVSFLEAEVLACGNCFDGILKLIYGFSSRLHVHFVLELMIGSLADFIEELTVPHATIYTVELALALETLHKLGVCHRDLKPANVMLDKRYHIKLGDFGCAKKIPEGKIIQDETYVGTFIFWAPENYERRWSQSSDWWSFGCTVFEMFAHGQTWKHFINSNSMQAAIQAGTLQATAIESRLGITKLSEQGKSLLQRCFNPKPEKRHPLKKHSGQPRRRFADLSEFLGVPIPVNSSVNIKDRFPFRNPVEFEEVPQNQGADQAQMLRHAYLDEVYRFIYQHQEIEFQDFYFDRNDTACYKKNSLLTSYLP